MFGPTQKKWLVVSACCFTACMMGLIKTAVPFIFQELSEKFSDEPATVTAGALSLHAGLGLFLAPLSRKMIDLTSYRMVAFLGGCALTVGFVILAFAGNIGIVYLAFFSSGVGASFHYLTSSTIVLLHLNEQKFLGLSMVSAAEGAGSIVSSHIITVISGNFGFRGVCFSLAFTSALTSLSAFAYFPPDDQSVMDPNVAKVKSIVGGLENEGFRDEENETGTRRNGLENSADDTPGQNVDSEIKSPNKVHLYWRSRIAKKIKEELHILTDPVFLAIVIALVGNGVSNALNQFRVVVMTERGFALHNISMYYSVKAVAATVLNPIIGIFYSSSPVKPYVKYLYSFTCIVTGATGILFGCITSYEANLSVGIAQTVANTSINGYLSGILVDLYGREKLLQYTAAARFCQGISKFLAPYLAGSLKHHLRRYDICFVIGGSIAGLSGMILGVAFLFQSRRCSFYSPADPKADDHEAVVQGTSFRLTSTRLAESPV